MKSNRQRRGELKARRSRFAEKRTVENKHYMLEPGRWLPVDKSKLVMGNTYDVAPDDYRDIDFECIDCGAEETWTARQQKWWHETAQGYFFATAVRCRPCRAKERSRKTAAREAHQRGLDRKLDIDT